MSLVAAIGQFATLAPGDGMTMRNFAGFELASDALGGAVWRDNGDAKIALAVFDGALHQPMIDHLAQAFGLVARVVDGVCFYLSPEPIAPIDDRAEALLSSVISAPSGRARALVIGARYRFAARALSAKDQRPLTRTQKGSDANIEISKRETIADSFYAFDRLYYRHRRFDGEWSPILEREILTTGDSVLVLPYDPWREEMVLIEQMRPAALARYSLDAWGLEAVAGVIGPGESPGETAEREMLEEAGLEAIALVPLAPSYQSGGALSQFMYPFIGITDLSGYRAGVFGLPDEHEDIRTHLVDLTEARRLLVTGEVNNALLQICLYALFDQYQAIGEKFASP